MYLVNQNILCIDDGVIVAVVDCKAKVQPSTTEAIWRKYPTAYQKYREHFTLLNWQSGKIQLVKVSEALWVCNLAGKERHKLDPEILQEAFTKLGNLSSEHKLKLHIPFETDFDEFEWSTYIQALTNFCPKSALCFFDSNIEDFLAVIKKPGFSLKELTSLILQKVSGLKVFNIRINAGVKDVFAAGYRGGYRCEGILTVLVSLDDLSMAINDLLKIAEFLQLNNELSNEANKVLIEYRNLLLEKLCSIPTKYRVRKSDGSEHQGIPIYDVFNILEDGNGLNLLIS
jgi:hypothetical protein